MLQLVEPPKIPRLVRSQAILREDGGHSGGRRVVKLVELSKTAGDSGAQALLQEGTELATPESEEEAVNLVGATKHPMVVGDKIFMRAEGIPRDEGEVQLAGSKWRMVPMSRFKWDLAGDLGYKIQDGESNTVVDWITIDLKARWRIVRYALKSQLQEVGKF
ncbi:hypothetical protein QL285_065502 [Trifolium repens]|nr:hypothetical protein QL285_065502 [Trifolium repens]